MGRIRYPIGIILKNTFPVPSAAGFTESHTVAPETFMQFCEKGICQTYKTMPDGSRQMISTYHYEKARGGITIYTEEEYENNRYLSVSDSNWKVCLPPRSRFI